MASMNLVNLETLFIEKLQEKYKLNKRDLKKAFSRFDKDNNGLLDLYELTQGIQLFLNGVKESQVRKLVSKYDMNGDGKISYDEFLHFLTTRSATEDDGDDVDVVSEDYDYSGGGGGSYNYSYREGDRGRGGREGRAIGREEDLAMQDYDDEHEDGGMQRYPARGSDGGEESRSELYSRESDMRSEVISSSSSPTQSDARSNMNGHNPRELEYRAKIFLNNMKAFLIKKASAMRMAGKLERTTAMMPASEMHESVARELMVKAFQPYTGQGDGKAREQLAGVEVNHFARVLRSFRFPGAPPLRTETIQYLFDMCSDASRSSAPGGGGGGDGEGGAGVSAEGDVLVNEEGRVVADPNVLTDLLFGAPTSTRDCRARGLNRVGAKQAAGQKDAQGRPVKGFVAQMENGRDLVGSGPVAMLDPVDANPAQKKALESISVPLRFVSKKSRSAMVVPSNFDPVTSIARSNQLPGYDLVRKHVFGMSGTSYSGNTVYALGSTPTSFPSSGKPSSARNNPDFIDPATIVYASAGLGVVHNLAENQQHFFEAHDDDITCITVSMDGVYAATGQMGKNPVVHIWPTDVSPANSKNPINTIGGNGFFSRGVCALAFSWDNAYLVAIGCDDNHAMGIFDTSSCELICEAPAQHGIPPQVKWVEYCAGQQHTEYITREHAGLCDLFATAGNHHLKVWSFKRPQGSEPGSLKYKAATMGKAAVTAAKAYLCCGFVYCEDRTYDFAAGGSNGVVYLWRAGKLIASQQVFRAKVKCMVVNADRLYCGGGGGGLKVLDARTLTIVQQFQLTPLASAPSGTGATPGSRGGSSSGARPRSASAGPATRLAHRAGAGHAIRPQRAPLAAPKKRNPADTSHAAGQNPHPAQESAGDAVMGRGMRDPDAEGAAGTAGEDDGLGAKLVTGLAVVRGHGRVAAQSTYVIASLGTGKLVRVEVGHASGAGSSGSGMGTPRSATGRPGSRPGTAGAGAGGAAGGDMVSGKDLFHYHTGPVYGLAADVTQSNRLVVTVCDDRKLMVWDAQDAVLLAKTATKTASRCCHVDKTNSFIAVGSAAGTLTVYYLSDQLLPRSRYYKVTEVGFRKDARAEVTEVKFSPSNERIAMGCRDDCIYVYNCELGTVPTGHGRNMSETGVCILRAMHKLKGHSSSITHLDWSFDSLLIRSTCAAYELLCWDVEAGKQAPTVNVADVKWKTQHCILGFTVMGIWPPYTDGTDINALDVCPKQGLVATANDQGGIVKLHNYPCVVRNAPGKEYTGHSSHVMNLKFMRDGELMMTAGGNDRSLVIWELVRDESLNDADGFR